MDGWVGVGREQVEEEIFLARLPLAHLMHIVAELSFPLGNHLTLIKGGRGDSGEKKDGSVSTLGKSSLERLEDSRVNSSICGNGQEKIKDRRTEEKEKTNDRVMVVHFERC